MGFVLAHHNDDLTLRNKAKKQTRYVVKL